MIVGWNCFTLNYYKNIRGNRRKRLKLFFKKNRYRVIGLKNFRYYLCADKGIDAVKIERIL